MVGNTSRAVCLVLFLAFPCVGCSDDDEEGLETESGTCNGVAGFSTCTQVEGDPQLVLEEGEFCVANGDTWTTDPCPTADLIGCCRTADDEVAFLECYYAPYSATAMELEEECVDFFEGTWTTASR
jgi:hypothetical protein